MPDSLTKEETELLKMAFELFDVNKDGVLTKDELTEAFKSLGDKNDLVVDHTFKTADKNADGKIQFEEFCKYLGKEFVKTIQTTED